MLCKTKQNVLCSFVQVKESMFQQGPTQEFQVRVFFFLIVDANFVQMLYELQNRIWQTKIHGY